MANNDDGGTNWNFRLEYEMTAGTTYLFGVKYWSSSKTGTIPFTFGKVYTISFNSNGGIGAPEQQEKDYGATITLSETIPTRTGYTFLGWSTSSTATSATYSQGDGFTTNANTTLYAVWKANTYTVKYDANGGVGTMAVSTHTYDVEKALSANTFTRDGYTFVGWATTKGVWFAPADVKYLDSEIVKNLSSVDNSTITLYAVWEENTYIINYDANGGTGAPASQTKTHGSNLTLSSTIPTRTGYTFLGWSTSSSATSATYSAGDPFTTDADTTLYAVWKINTYTVSYDANGGTGAPPSQTKTHGAKLTLSSIEPTREGYTFLGWTRYPTTQTVTHVPGGEFITNADTTLYALWEKNAPVIANQWAQDDHGWRYYDSNGNVVTNKWLMDSIGWCYVGVDGYCVTNCWRRDSYGWCYLGADGRMVTNMWVKDSVGWCYVGANGYCVTNKWVKDSHGWCYLDANGRMATNQWIKDTVGWCYVGADGYCLTNAWAKDSVGWCYLDANGRMVYSKWIQYNNQWYYIDANGYMVTGTKVINGKTYKFNSSGVWIG